MPPKKAAPAKGAGKGGGGGKKKKGEAAAPPPPPEDPVTAAHRRALIERAVALRQEVDRETQAAIELRNAVARKEEAWTAGTKALADAQSSLGASTLSSKSTSVAHEETLVTRRQGLRQAIQEQREELVQRKIEAHAEVEAAEDARWFQDEGHRVEYREAKVALKAREVEQAAARLQAQKALAAAVGALREEYEGKMQAAQEEQEARVAALRAKADEDRRAELAALEGKKLARLEATKAAHALELADLKSRYNTQIEAQRQRLEELRVEARDLRRRVRQDQQRLVALKEEKEARAAPLARAAEGLAAWEAGVAALEGDSSHLRSLERWVQEEEKAVRALERDGEALRRRLHGTQAEAAELRARTHAAVLRAQQRGGFAVLLLENKLRRLQARLDAHHRKAAARAEAAAAARAYHAGAGVVVVVGKAAL